MQPYEHQLPYLASTFQRLMNTGFDLMHLEGLLRYYGLPQPMTLGDEIGMAQFHLNAAEKQLFQAKEAFEKAVAASKINA